MPSSPQSEDQNFKTKSLPQFGNDVMGDAVFCKDVFKVKSASLEHCPVAVALYEESGFRKSVDYYENHVIAVGRWCRPSIKSIEIKLQGHRWYQ
jgi:hypothetical protein